MLVEISSQPKAACGAATVFQVICDNPHVMHKGTWFLPIFSPRRDRMPKSVRFTNNK
ncbi:MAG: hypothetical protein LBF04_05820 [Prevotellaceae bacterium]|nr:hypothetical protein [Prevotellaceae bacterium]